MAGETSGSGKAGRAFVEILGQRRPWLIFFFFLVTRLIVVTECLTRIKPKGKKVIKGRDCHSGEPSGRRSEQLVT